MKALVDRAGGVEEFHRHANQVIKETKNPAGELTRRSLAYWIWEGGPPQQAAMLILATAIHAGIGRKEALEIYPQLAHAHSLAAIVAEPAA